MALTVLGILHQFSVGFRPPGVDALCPFGGLEALFAIVASGTLLQRIAVSSFVLLGATVLVALVFRRSFCGNICPLGTLQELTRRLGRRIVRRRFSVPVAIDKPARYLKYLLLVVIIALSAALGELVIRPYDPWVAYQHILTAEIITGFLGGLVILGVSLVGSFFYDRFFCKYLCPMGAFLGLVGKIGWFRIRRTPEVCTSCGACDRACPVNLPVSTTNEVRSAECLSCNQCILACPVSGALQSVGPTRKRRSIRPRTFLLLSAGLFAVVVGVASVTGSFEWKVPSIAETVSKTGGLNPADIKGSDTFASVAELSGVAKQEFKGRFAISDEDFAAPIKDAAHRAGSGFEVQDVRDFIADRLE